MMEWTLDYKGLYENPLLTSEGQQEIKRLSSENSVSIPSLTGDCFMQAPFWKASGEQQDSLKRDFMMVVDACSIMGIKYIVVPLVDNGSLEAAQEEEVLVEFTERHTEVFQSEEVVIVFESDFDPPELKRFIAQFPVGIFGINYDTGNSASLGYQLEEEFEAYGGRIMNVHLKDRLLGGTTVPLGAGNAKLPETISALERRGYQGNYILQTARAVDSDHVGEICRYHDMVKGWIEQARWN
jgi:hexulose-6-phosphate isomerase